MTWHESATPWSETSNRVIPAEGYLGCETHEWLISVKKLKLSPILSFASVDFWTFLVQGKAFLFVRADILYIDPGNLIMLLLLSFAFKRGICIIESDILHLLLVT